MAEQNVDRELGWDDEIERDNEYEVLPEGDYDFEVTGFERGRHNGSDKLPACGKAIVSIRIEGEAGVSTIKHNLFLHTITEGMLSAFFTGIGQRKKGEKYAMNWNKVVGSTGRAKVGIKKWKNNDGEEKVFNEVKRFYEPEESTSGGYQPGRF